MISSFDIFAFDGKENQYRLPSKFPPRSLVSRVLEVSEP
tara:strand:- start:362 stop:478 length:117 start_codon:yes stop_codon:yes gene_type:complete